MAHLLLLLIETEASEMKLFYEHARDFHRRNAREPSPKFIIQTILAWSKNSVAEDKQRKKKLFGKHYRKIWASLYRPPSSPHIARCRFWEKMVLVDVKRRSVKYLLGTFLLRLFLHSLFPLSPRQPSQKWWQKVLQLKFIYDCFFSGFSLLLLSSSKIACAPNFSTTSCKVRQSRGTG